MSTALFKKYSKFYLLVFLFSRSQCSIPLIISTWRFDKAAEKALEYLLEGRNHIDSLEAGCTVCEELQCDGTVGFGGSPDENGETTLDAMIFDGSTMDMGAVAGLRRVKGAISVAKKVLQHTKHSLLGGDLASEFAIKMGHKEESLATQNSTDVYLRWKDKNKCQPNFWKNVEPNPRESCGPYNPISDNSIDSCNRKQDVGHDTIGMVVIDSNCNVAAGTSTNGLKYKIPGRIGDSPIPGAGAYADSEIGGAAATGDGDVMMRFLPSFVAVEEMKNGLDPSDAAKVAIDRISRKFPTFFGAVIAANVKGEFGAACSGMDTFTFAVGNREYGKVVLKKVACCKE